MKSKAVKNIINIILAYSITIALALVSDYSITGIDLILPCVFTLSTMVLMLSDRYAMPGISFPAVFSGLLLSLGAVLGSHMHMDDPRYVEPFRAMDIVLALILGYFFYHVTVISCIGLGHLQKIILKKNKIELSDRRLFLYCFIGIMICFLPYYIVLFPGNMGKDTFESLDIINGIIPLSNHQPVAFSAFLALIIKGTAFLGNLTWSLGILSFIHMSIYIACLSYIILWMNRRELGKGFVLASAAFFALHPFMAMYSIYITKDVLFSVVMVAFILMLYDLRRTNPILLTIVSLLLCLLRNNGIYILLAMFLWILIIYGDIRKRIILCFLSVFILYGLYKGPVFDALDIEDSSFAESASMPLAQLGYVLCEDPSSIEDADREFLNKLLPEDTLKEVYTLGYTDPYKFHPDFDDEFLNNNVGEYMKIYLRTMRKNLGKYIEAYLAQTCGYWHYGISNTVATQGVAENDYGVTSGNGPYTNIVAALMLGMRKAPLLCILSSMGAQIFAVIMVIVFKLSRKSKVAIETVTPLLPIFLLWGTIMVATPAYCLFRYMYPAFILWPIIIYELLKGCKNGQNSNSDTLL